MSARRSDNGNNGVIINKTNIFFCYFVQIVVFLMIFCSVYCMAKRFVQINKPFFVVIVVRNELERNSRVLAHLPRINQLLELSCVLAAHK